MSPSRPRSGGTRRIEAGSHFLQQVTCCKRFGDPRGIWLELALVPEAGVRITGHVHHAHVAVAFAETPGELDASELRHHHVGHEEIDAAMARRTSERVFAIYGFDYRIPAATKDPARRGTGVARRLPRGESSLGGGCLKSSTRLLSASHELC